MDRFKELQTEISNLEKQVEKAKIVNEEKVKKKDAQLKRVLRRESDVKKTVDEQKSIIKNLASIWKSRRIGQKYIRRKDQQKNLQLLEEAMKDGEISKELYQVISYLKAVTPPGMLISRETRQKFSGMGEMVWSCILRGVVILLFFFLLGNWGTSEANLSLVNAP